MRHAELPQQLIAHYVLDQFENGKHTRMLWHTDICTKQPNLSDSPRTCEACCMQGSRVPHPSVIYEIAPLHDFDRATVLVLERSNPALTVGGGFPI